MHATIQMWMNVVLIMEVVLKYALTLKALSSAPVMQDIPWLPTVMIVKVS